MRRCPPGAIVDYAVFYDSDTGLYGKGLFEILGGELLEQARRYGPSLSLALYRTEWVDGQKQGDPEQIREVLHYLGLLLVENLRRCDIAAHLGSGTFAVLLPHTSLSVAQEVSTRMCKTIIGSPAILRSGDQIQIVASVGVAVYDKHIHELKDFWRTASHALDLAPRPWEQAVGPA